MILEELRKKCGMTQSELATLAGVRQNTVSQWESGKRRPSVEVAKRVGAVLGFDWTQLYEEHTQGIADQFSA